MTTNWRGMAAMVERVSSAIGREQNGRFSIEGTRLHERALRAGGVIEQALVGESFRASHRPRIQKLLAELEASGCQIAIAPDAELARMTDGRGLGAIFGLLKLPPQPDLAALLAKKAGKTAVFLAAIDITDPGNAGAMARTAHALNAAALIAVGVTDPFHPKAIRTAMGSLFKLPVLRCPDYAAFAAITAALGIETIATVAANGDPLPQIDFSAPRIAVLMGNEYRGLPNEISAAADQRATIPMPAGVDSLSVNAATAVALYEAGRARR